MWCKEYKQFKKYVNLCIYRLTYWNQVFNKWLLTCLTVQQQQQEEGEAEQCQIVCKDMSSIELDWDQLWDFTAAVQEGHPDYAILHTVGIQLHGLYSKASELSASYIPDIHRFLCPGKSQIYNHGWLVVKIQAAGSANPRPQFETTVKQHNGHHWMI